VVTKESKEHACAVACSSLVLAGEVLSQARAGLVALKQQLFERHAPHLPRLGGFVIPEKLALAVVSKSQAHLKHLIAIVAANKNAVLGEAGDAGPAHALGGEENCKIPARFLDGEFTGGILGARGLTSLDALFHL